MKTRLSLACYAAATTALLIGCGKEAPPPGGSAGTTGGGEGGAGGAGPACAESGVAKGPWSLSATETGATLRWEACRAGAASGVRIVPEGGGSEQAATSTETSFEVLETYTAPLNPNAIPDYAGTWHLHEVVLDGLSPATCYRYELEADPTRSGRFCTARAPGDPFRFMAIADTNPGLNDFTSRVLEQVLPENPDFVIHAGDVQYYDSGLETWDFWFGKMQPMLSQGAFFPAVGNHEFEKEDEYAAYFARYFVSNPTSYYAFSSGGVHFFSLDSELPLSLGSQQGAWLDARLSEAAAAHGFRFSVVYLHKPLVTCGDKSSDDAVRAQFTPLFDSYGVTLVIQAHMHGYERFELDGITYVTTGGGGGALGDVDENIDRPECAFREASGAFRHAMSFDVGAGELRMAAIDDQGAIRDEVTKIVP